MSTILLLDATLAALADGPQKTARYLKLADFLPRVGDHVVVKHEEITIKLRVDAIEWEMPRPHGEGKGAECSAILQADRVFHPKETRALDAEGWTRLS